MKQKKLFKQLTLAAFIVVGTFEVIAYDFEVDGIYYNRNSDMISVSVTYGNNCYYSDEVDIPSTITHSGIVYSVTTIAEGAFSRCTDLLRVSIPNSVTFIKNGAFNYCTNLNSISVANDNPKYDSRNNCNAIIETTSNALIVGCQSTVIPNSVTTIGNGAFHGCARLTSIEIPNSVNTIGEYAFRGCNGLTSITLSNSLTTIGEKAFYYCSELTSIDIPKSVSSIGSDAFWNCYHLKKVNISDLAAWCSIDFHGENSNPLNNAHHLYLNNTEITDLVIPNSVTSIGHYAFSRWTALTSVTIPNSVTAIGGAAFSDCSGLTNITIPNSVTSISMLTFRGCRGLLSANLPDSLISIGDEAFSGCIGLTNVTIPNSVTSIGSAAFYGCSALLSIGIPDSVKEILDFTFYNCSSLANVSIGKSIKSIATDAFSNCSGITKLVWRARDCSTMGSMPKANIEIAIIDSEVEMIPQGFVFSSKISSITIPSSVTSIGNGAFYGCTGLTSVNIPESVTSIGASAFKGCNNLRYAVLLRSTPPTGANEIFPDNQLIYVPKVYNYQNDSYWNRYILQGFYESNAQITMAKLSSNNAIFELTKAILKDKNGGIVKTYYVQDSSLIITDLTPNIQKGNDISSVSDDLSVFVKYDNQEYEFEDNITTKATYFGNLNSTTTTQTVLTPTFTINRDEGFILDACGVESSSDSYSGSIKETINNRYVIETAISNLSPNSNYSYRPWVIYKGEKYYGTYTSLQTNTIDAERDVTLTPTSVYLSSGITSAGDAHVKDTYFTFNGENSDPLYQTGLDPNTNYNYTYTIETTTGNQVNNYSFRTPAISMVAQPVKMLTNTKVMLMAETNVIDEETTCGFEWRRYEAPDEMPSTQVYSPVFGGVIAGTLKNMTENVYYKYRPFYKSNTGHMYYGNWVAFLTADAGIEYNPMVYTYKTPAVTQSEATLQGVAIQGSSEISEQGFEYWKTGNNNITIVTATGERMSKKINSLQANTKYTFRAFVTAGGETYYGNDVDFVTQSNSLDVNLDGEINIADVNAVIDFILTGASGSTGDVNGDGEVNIADINTIIDRILSN